jgi:hypothetical protein
MVRRGVGTLGLAVLFCCGGGAGSGLDAGDDNIDMVDEHSYRSSGWVRSNFDYFDKYRRKPWKVYVGEYAHHPTGGCIQGNRRAQSVVRQGYPGAVESFGVE